MQITFCNLEDCTLFTTKLNGYFYVHINLKDSGGVNFTSVALM